MAEQDYQDQIRNPLNPVNPVKNTFAF